MTWRSYFYWKVLWLWNPEGAEKHPDWPWERCENHWCEAYYLKGEKCPGLTDQNSYAWKMHEMSAMSHACAYWTAHYKAKAQEEARKEAMARRIEKIAKHLGIE